MALALRFFFGFPVLIALSAATPLSMSYQVQAPFDAYVCFNMSFSDCTTTIGAAASLTFIKSLYANIFTISGPLTPIDSDSGRVIVTQDTRYKCDDGKIPYTVSNSQVMFATVAFVSPSLLLDLAEQMLQLRRLRAACSRLLDEYEYQSSLLADQDNLARAQRDIQILSAYAENATLQNTKNNISVYQLSDVQLKKLNLWADPHTVMPSINGAQVLMDRRFEVTSDADKLRQSTVTHLQNVEFANKFSDAQAAIDTQLRVLAREEFLLDNGIVIRPRAQIKEKKYDNGFWLVKGNVVAIIQYSDPTSSTSSH